MAKKADREDIQKVIAALFKRTEEYADKVRRHYADAVEALLKISARRELPEDGVFSFADNKRMSEEATRILRELYSRVYNEIKEGVLAEWEYANVANDALIVSIFGKKVLEDNHFARWFSRNQEAVDAFFKRKSAYGGLNLSQKVWKYTGALKTELELALSLSMGAGKSAATISREVRQLLQQPDRLFRRIRIGMDKDGNPLYKLSKAAAAYHPGRGVYRSSYKNAMRLTRTETNMAYRAADHDRWQRMDFVIGQHVILSNNHTLNGVPFTDICDDLSGKNEADRRGRYPKGFKFTGWHPMCRCFVVPILASPEELERMEEAMMKGQDYTPEGADQYKEMPENFRQWQRENKDRIDRARQRGTLPYFLRDNEEVLKGKTATEKANTKSVFPDEVLQSAKLTKQAAKQLQGTYIENPYFPHKVLISGRSIKEWTNQPFKYFKEKNELLLNIQYRFKDFAYIGVADNHKKVPRIVQSHLFKWEVYNENMVVIVREWDDGQFILHSVSEGLP